MLGMSRTVTVRRHVDPVDRLATGHLPPRGRVHRDVIDAVDGTGTDLTDGETDRLLAAADLVTLARTGVDYDYRGDVIDAHAPEMPTRFAKQLAQVVRGGVAISMDRRAALQLAVRCARDSMPPLRLAILLDIAAHPYSRTADVQKRLGKPRATVDRQLQALQILDVLDVAEQTTALGTVWVYHLAAGVDPSALDPGQVPEMLVGCVRNDSSLPNPITPRTNKSGTALVHSLGSGPVNTWRRSGRPVE